MEPVHPANWNFAAPAVETHAVSRRFELSKATEVPRKAPPSVPQSSPSAPFRVVRLKLRRAPPQLLSQAAAPPDGIVCTNQSAAHPSLRGTNSLSPISSAVLTATTLGSAPE